jgi:hypothetical protein
MFIARKSLSSGKVRSIDLPVTPEQLQAYYDGEAPSKCLKQLTLAQREFVISGMSSEEWNEVFGPLDTSFGRA